MMSIAIRLAHVRHSLSGDTARRNRHVTQITWIAWAGFYLAVCAVFFWKETGLPVNNAYATGADRWMAHSRLYDQGCGFIYFPQSAIAYSPFRRLPFAAEQIAWRLLSVSLFAAGVFRVSRLAGGAKIAEIFSLTTLLVLPKAWTCAYSGQATLPMVGLSMLALAEIPGQKWWRSAAFAIAALAFKPLALVVILLMAALHSPLRSRIAVGLIMFGLVPYAWHDVSYVNSQYWAMLPMFDDAAHVGMETVWAQLFSLCSLAGINIPELSQTCLRVAAAAGTLALCCRACQSELAASETSARSDTQPNSPLPGWLVVLSLSTAYLLLFNPRTENNSYVMLSPVLGLLCARAYAVEQRKTRGACLAAGALALVAGHELCGWLTPNAGFIWLCPLVCLVFTVDCVLEVIRGSEALAFAEGLQTPESMHLVFPTAAVQSEERGEQTRAA